MLSLKCSVCSSSTTNEECNKNTQECQVPVDMCMTITTLGNYSNAGFLLTNAQMIKMLQTLRPKFQIFLRFLFILCLGSAKSIVKQCASQTTCRSASSSVNSKGDGNTISCCNTHNLCNFSGATSIHMRTPPAAVDCRAGIYAVTLKVAP